MLDNAIKKSGLTKLEVAQRIGCTRQYLDCLIKHKVQSPSYSVIKNLATVLQVPIEEVYPTEKTSSCVLNENDVLSVSTNTA